jgi:lipopolysaccharide/colanic/teichoic acid biosynthesis glycosyltransferase
MTRERERPPLARVDGARAPSAGHRRTATTVKSTFDFVVAALAEILAVPVFVVLGAVILVLDGRPIFFSPVESGEMAVPFRMYKVRTMISGAEDELAGLKPQNEQDGPLFKLARDPRVTRSGRLLLEFSLDELPQLFNVLRGEMSLVGPRPARPD